MGFVQKRAAASISDTRLVDGKPLPLMNVAKHDIVTHPEIVTQ